MDWYTAATMLEKQRQQGLNTSQISTIPFFENLFPAGLASIMNNTFGLDLSVAETTLVLIQHGQTHSCSTPCKAERPETLARFLPVMTGRIRKL